MVSWVYADVDVFIQNKTTYIHIFTPKNQQQKIIPDKQFHQVLKKVQTDLEMHLY